jgi:hypothetical protein
MNLVATLSVASTPVKRLVTSRFAGAELQAH